MLNSIGCVKLSLKGLWHDVVLDVTDTHFFSPVVKVSFYRITSFLVDDELKDNMMTTKQETENSSNNIRIQDGNFAWDPESTTPTLRNVHHEVKRGQKGVVCGSFSFLFSQVDVFGSIDYVSQISWIQSGTIQDNILNRPKRALSGGQKQMIQLARAVYNDADIYLLDDPFSSVDAHTAATLFNARDCVMTSLEKKTVILVTHQLEFLSSVDNILVMQDGQVKQSGNYEYLLTAGTAFEQLVKAYKEVITGLEPSHSENKAELQK
ncbi:ABC transporter C family member 8-like protein isoform X1 [Tanacetum coccineum]|uniref:ABC transporter C family member 8-like protein isoform X1 n=1 Tax=Tanacetum coccineum TaxID=301880 RepID=A0ABQ5BCX0_9ASTR